MGDPIPTAKTPVYNSFDIKSASAECLQAPADPAKDPCKIQIDEVETGVSIVLDRKNGVFQAAPADAAKFTKTYPTFRVPGAELAEYLFAKSEFSKVFGDEQNPSEIFKKVTIVFGGNEVSDKTRAIFNWLNTTTNFITHGQLDPKHLKMKALQETTIRVGAYTFADPVLGVLVEKILKSLKDNPKLSSDSRNRVEWLLSIYATREKFWAALKPAMDKSVNVGDQLKGRSVELLTFLFANHILAEKGYNSFLYSDQVKEAAKTFHQVFTKVDPSYNAGKNYYAYMKSAVSELRTVNIPEAQKRELLLRIGFLESEYTKAAQKEMIDILSSQPDEQSYREYLKIKYGDTPLRAEALDIILKNTAIKAENGSLSFVLPMDKISKELKDWANGKSPEKRQEAITAILFLLKNLFEKDGKMEVFWDKKLQQTDNFYQTGNFTVMSYNKKALESLIVWARNSASDEKVTLPPEELPHTALRKWTFGSELGIGVAGLGVGTALAFAPIKDKNTQYFTQGGAFIIGSSALGSATGNFISYKTDATKNLWVYDVGGAIVGGLLGGLIYGLTTTKPPAFGGPGNPNDDPARRNPVDGYGP
ncbi:MAG: hypothetical protein K8R69_01650 [Deltaproteobacteria bacterium]|nr:hypothetical protein [Deltaproteobacteria bacterium]